MADSSIVIIIISICCLVSISLVAGGYFYYKQLPVEDTDTDPSTMSQPTMTSTTTSNIATTIKPTTTSNTTTTIKPTSTSNTTTTPVAKPSAWKSYCTTYCPSENVKSYAKCDSYCNKTNCTDCDYTGPYVSS